MTPQNESHPPLPRGEGAGGEGRANAPTSEGRAKKLGHGWAPAFDEDRQKDVFDFGCYSARLLIEIDGSIHRLPEVQANDKAKTLHAIEQGFRLLRFANHDVWDRPAWVVDQVRARLDAPHPPTPSDRSAIGESKSAGPQTARWPQGRGGDDV